MTSSQSLYISNRANWQTTLSNALVITRREMLDSFRDWRIIVPIVLLTFFFPFLAQFAAGRISSFLAQYGAEYIGEQFIPFLLMVVGFFPISISLVIALETFAGEKERRSLEPLLSTPLTNTELYIGKTLAAMIPPLTASFGGMTFYLITLYWRGASWQPPLMLVVQMFMLTSVQALVMVAGAVVVSSQTTSSRAANLLASFIIIPMTLIVNAESIIIFLAPDGQSENGIFALWWIAVGMIVAAILLLRVGNSIFNREELLGRTFDTLNLIGIFKKIWRYMRAVDDAGTVVRNPLEWYTHAIPYSLRKMRQPILITILVFAVYFAMGYAIGQQSGYRLPLDSGTINVENVTTGGFGGVDGQQAFFFIFQNNATVLLLAFVLAAVSFGVAAYIVVPPVFVVLGYLASQLFPAGYGTVFLAAVLPHGIVEISTIVLATAAVFRLGSIVTKPPRGQTVGHAWLVAFGDTLKIALGVILPGLLIAALLEAYVTFPILQSVMQGLG
jgi:uncharacterized membrane protein SpoIIM required for sporulation